MRELVCRAISPSNRATVGLRGPAPISYAPFVVVLWPSVCRFFLGQNRPGFACWGKYMYFVLEE